MATLKYWLWLTTRRGLGGSATFQVLDHFGTPEGAFFADPGEYDLLETLSPQAKTSLRDHSLDAAEQILADCDRLGISICTVQDAAYPDRLKHIYDPPALLYRKGRDIAFDEELAIAVVGTRQPTPYGVKMAAKIGLDLARQGALVVSGIARGLDAAALRGALNGGGPVVSVLAGGIDVVYPPEHRDLYADVAAAGALISEYPPGAPNNAKHFPHRNRIVSGLSLGVVAVECQRQSGTMITANAALDQNRDLFAVPGNADAPMSGGTNWLIQSACAKLVTCGWDIVQEYEALFPHKIRAPQGLPAEVEQARLQTVTGRVSKPAAAPVSDKKEVDNPPDRAYIDWQDHKEKLTDDQRELLLALNDAPLQVDELIARTQIPARLTLPALTILQVMGYITEEPGKYFSSRYLLRI